MTSAPSTSQFLPNFASSEINDSPSSSTCPLIKGWAVSSVQCPVSISTLSPWNSTYSAGFAIMRRDRHCQLDWVRCSFSPCLFCGRVIPLRTNSSVRRESFFGYFLGQCTQRLPGNNGKVNTTKIIVARRLVVAIFGYLAATAAKSTRRIRVYRSASSKWYFRSLESLWLEIRYQNQMPNKDIYNYVFRKRAHSTPSTPTGVMVHSADEGAMGDLYLVV